MSQAERIAYLLSQVLDGDPTEIEFAELNQLLKADAAGRDLLADSI